MFCSTMGVVKVLGILVLVVAVLVGVIMVAYPVPDDLQHPWHARGVQLLFAGTNVVVSDVRI